MRNPKPISDKAEAVSDADAARLVALGGEPLAGSGFETEEPELGFSESDISGLAPDQNPA